MIATIIRRLPRNRRGGPLATRFDPYERITSEPQPFLFQRTIGQRTEVINPGTLGAELAKPSDALAVEHPELAGCRFTPHDFRRLFATDLVNHGLPIHIGAGMREAGERGYLPGCCCPWTCLLKAVRSSVGREGWCASARWPGAPDGDPVRFVFAAVTLASGIHYRHLRS